MFLEQITPYLLGLKLSPMKYSENFATNLTSLKTLPNYRNST